MKIKLNSVSIKDYDKALRFYTDILGFEKKHDEPLGNGDRWLTVVSPQEPDGTELLLEPNADYPAMKALKEALVADGIPPLPPSRSTMSTPSTSACRRWTSPLRWSRPIWARPPWLSLTTPAAT